MPFYDLFVNDLCDVKRLVSYRLHKHCDRILNRHVRLPELAYTIKSALLLNGMAATYSFEVKRFSSNILLYKLFNDLTPKLQSKSLRHRQFIGHSDAVIISKIKVVTAVM